MKTRHFPGFSVVHTDKSDDNINSIASYKNLLTTHSLPHPPKIVEANQVHQSHLCQVTTTTPDESKITGCDGLLTRDHNTALLIKTADCIPIVFYDPSNHGISAIHAGWRGLVQGFPTKTIGFMTTHLNSQPDSIQIYIGPAIRQCCYIFQDEPTQTHMPDWQEYVAHDQKGWHIDLVGHLKLQLTSLGIASQNIIDSNECTFHNKQWHSFFRHKQTQDPYGTNATIVQLT